MALTITKNDISGVFGNPAPLKITKSDISSVYAPKAAVKSKYSPAVNAIPRLARNDTPGQSSVILNEAKRSELAVCRGRQLVCRPRANARYGGARASQRLQPEESHSHKTATLSDTSPFTITKSDISTIYSAPKTTDKTPPQTAYAGAKQKKKGSLADTLMAFGDRWKEGGRTSFENFASAADYSSIGISQMADMEKRLQNIDITDPQRISDAMKANYEQKGINSPAALATKQKIADRTRQQQQRQAQLYEKHRNAPFADRAVKLGFVTGAAAPSIITGGVVSPGFATALNAVNSYGAAQGQAISEDATLQQSGLYAAATAGKEYGINQLFGGIPYLSGKTYSPNAINILGEGAENVLSDVTQPYLKRIFYDKDAPAPTFKDLLSSFADGVDVSLFLNTAPEFVKIKPDDRMGIIHKAYAAELDRQIKQEMKEKHPELFEMQKENKVDTDSILGYNMNSGNDINSEKYHSSLNDEDYEYKSYKNSLEKGELSPLADFDLYKRISKQIDENLVGITTANGIKITGKTMHSIARVIGSVEQRRNGVSIDDVLDALISKNSEISPIKIIDGDKSQKFKNNTVEVTINPDTGVIVQTNPAHSRKKVK